MKTHPIIGYLVNSHARLIEQRQKEEAQRQAEEIRLAKARIRFYDAGQDDVRRSGIHAAYMANEGRRRSKPAEVVVYCETCIEPMRPGVAHWCRPPHTPLDRSAQ